MYYIGIDGSGSYSKLLAIDEDEQVIGRHVGNSINVDIHPVEIVKSSIVRLLEEFYKLTNATSDDCGGLCIVFSNNSSVNVYTTMSEIVSQIGISCPLYITNEAEATLSSVTKGGAGVLIVAGVNSAGYAFDENGTQTQCGGLGHLVDDEGSAYWVGMQAVKHAFMSMEGRIPKTVLEQKVKEYFGVNVLHECLSIIYDDDNFSDEKVAGLALSVKYAAKEGDKQAILIEQNAVYALLSIAEALIRQTRLEKHTVVLSGKLFAINDFIRVNLTGLIKKKFKEVDIVFQKDKAELGAAYLAKNTAKGLLKNSFRKATV